MNESTTPTATTTIDNKKDNPNPNPNHNHNPLMLLLKFTKKKYIKKLFEYSLILNGEEKNVNPNFSTPIIETLQQTTELSSSEIHHLILSCIELINLTIKYKFDQEKLSRVVADRIKNQQQQQREQPHEQPQQEQEQQEQEDLLNVIVGVLLSLEEQIKSKEKVRLSQGKMLDMEGVEWNVDLETINHKSNKVNTPIVQIKLPLIDTRKASLTTVAFEMKGEQFQVFFKNLDKIKSTLNELVAEEEIKEEKEQEQNINEKKLICYD